MFILTTTHNLLPSYSPTGLLSPHARRRWLAAKRPARRALTLALALALTLPLTLVLVLTLALALPLALPLPLTSA